MVDKKLVELCKCHCGYFQREQFEFCPRCGESVKEQKKFTEKKVEVKTMPGYDTELEDDVFDDTEDDEKDVDNDDDY